MVTLGDKSTRSISKDHYQSKNSSLLAISKGRVGSLSEEKTDWFQKFMDERKKTNRILSKLQQMNVKIDEEFNNETIQMIQSDMILNVEVQGQSPQNFFIEAGQTMKDFRDQIQKTFSLDADDFVLKFVENNILFSDFSQIQETESPQKLKLELVEEFETEGEYEEDNFEKEEENMIEAIKFEEVENMFKRLRILMQIKKIDHDKVVKYLFHNEKVNGKKVKLVSINHLENMLKNKLKFNSEAILMSRYLIEKPNEQGKVSFDENLTIKKKILKDKITKILGKYSKYNGFAITHLLSRLTDIIDSKKNQLEEGLKELDNDDSGTIDVTEFKRLLNELNLPPLQDDILEFFEYLNFRNSQSVDKMNYQKFLEIFDDDYLVGSSPYEDPQEFQPSSDTSDEDVDEQDKVDQDDGLNEEDLMITVDDVLTKLRMKFKENFIKSFYISILDSVKEEMINDQKIRYILESELIHYLQTKLNLNLNEKEQKCLIHILSREDLQGIILFDELKQLIRNFTKKEKVLQKSFEIGIQYQKITKEQLEFLIQIKQLVFPNQEGIRSITLSEILAGIIQDKVIIGKQQRKSIVQVVNFDDMIDTLFMKFQIKCPPQKTLNSLKKILSIDSKFPELVLLKKLERIINDLDIIYVNLLKFIRNPESSNKYISPMKNIQEKNNQKKVKFESSSSEDNEGQKIQRKQEQIVEEDQTQDDQEFQYDKFRKKYTVKAQEVMEEIEEDL